MEYIGHKNRGDFCEDRIARISNCLFSPYAYPLCLYQGTEVWFEYEDGKFDIYRLSRDYSCIDELVKEVSSLFPYKQKS